jgi:CHASE3 domain sensor protein
MFRNKSLITIKYALICLVLLVMAILSLLIIKKNNIKVTQKEETMQLDIQGKINICLPNENQ